VTASAVLGAQGLSKRFTIYPSSLARLADWLRVPSGPRYREFWALRDVSFELDRGECLGIIGPNGAGKTTLLKLLTGVLTPTYGKLATHGRVLSLLELGSDFSPELTGRQNARESMRLLGLGDRDAQLRLAETEEFAELGEYFDRPVKMFSSGMFVRLAFSLFSTLEPEIFLVDEALTVGDLRFSAKALARIRDMRKRGTTLLFVSHNLEIVNQLCSRVLWIQAGRVHLDGAPGAVTAAYTQFMVHGGNEVARTETHAVPAADPTADAPDLALGQGWYPLEAYGGDVFRWASGSAELVLTSSSAEQNLLLDVEPAPRDRDASLSLWVDGGDGPPTEVTLRGRDLLQIPLSVWRGEQRRIRLLAQDGGRALPGDERNVTLRAFRWGWSADNLQPIHTLVPWIGDEMERELQYELGSMRAAIARDVPIRAARARMVQVVTRDRGGQPATRFGTSDAITLDVSVEALREVPALIVGVVVKDMFGHGLYRTRSDQQTTLLPSLAPGESATLRFHCPALLLGFGLYHLDIGICGEGLESEIWQLVERAWRFQVLNNPQLPIFGTVNLGWQYRGRVEDGAA
jgi:ABC-type polysaccharide/polyol phosphate transport system ATPase subunit